MEIEISELGSARILTVEDDRIDAAVAIAFKEKVLNAAEGGPEQIVLNLSNVQFIDSSGLGSIVASMKLVAPEHTLDLSGLSPTVEKVFRLTRMDTVFRIYMNAEDAVRANVA